MKSKPRSKTLAETIREHVSTLHAERAALVVQRDEVAAEIEAIQTAPIARADALQFCLDYIDSRAAAYLDNFDHMVTAFDAVAWPRRYDVPIGGLSGVTKGEPLCLRDVDAGLSGDFARISSHFNGGLRFFGANSNGHHSDEAAYFFFGDIIKAKVREHFDRLYPAPKQANEQPYLSIVERRERIASLGKKLDALNADLAGIDTELWGIRADATAQPARPAPGAPEPARRELRSEEIQQRDRDIYRDFNGRNDEALAARYGVTRGHVMRVGCRPVSP